MVNDDGSQAAPGRLEDVRALLNSWLIPNETRLVEDRFDSYAAQHELAADQRDTVRRLRDDLRAVVERSTDVDTVLNPWIDRLDVRPYLSEGTVGYRHVTGMPGDVVVTVLTSLASGTWPRLKACPDCRWVFYDHTRNAGKRWCLMTAGGPDGRSCGSIAKVRAYRQRTGSQTS